MITREFVIECLDILDLKYTELESGTIGISFYDEAFFSHQIVTFIDVADNVLTFRSRAVDYHPAGDLLALANRHNCRTHAPCCFIDPDGEVVMDWSYFLKPEVSPHYILENAVRPGIYLPLEAFANLELTDSEIEERRNRLND